MTRVCLPSSTLQKTRVFRQRLTTYLR